MGGWTLLRHPQSVGPRRSRDLCASTDAGTAPTVTGVARGLGSVSGVGTEGEKHPEKCRAQGPSRWGCCS